MSLGLERPLFGLLLLLATALAQETRQKDVIYGRKHGTALTLDVIKPATPNRAAVVYVVSGGWVSAPEGIRPRLFGELTGRGYTVFAVVHASTPKYTIPEVVPDIHRAVRFVRHGAKRFGIDKKRVGILGTSAGGHLSLMVGTAGTKGDKRAIDPVERESSRVQAVAAFFPPTDFLNWGKQGVRVTDTILMQRFMAPFDFKTYDKKKNAYLPVTDREEIARILKEISPITHASRDDPPTLFIHGSRDPLVPVQQSEILFAKLEALGVKTRLVVKEGKAHGWLGFGSDLRTVAEWFDTYLK